MFEADGGGGIGRVAHEMAEAFAADHEVLFIYPGKVTRQKKEGKLRRLMIESKGESDVMIPLLNRRNIHLIFNCLEKFSPEVIHAHDPGPLSFLIQTWATRKKVPFVYTSHVLPTKIVDFGAGELGQLGKILRSRLVSDYFSYFFNHCQGVIALNKTAKEDFLRLGYQGEIFLVPNGRHIKTYWRPKSFTKEKTLVFIGYLTERKNQKYLIEMMRYLEEDFSLLLIGSPINEKYFLELKKKVEKYKLKNVFFLGEIPHRQIPSFLAKAKVFVSASRMEVQSLVILEALASGTPVVGLSNETIDEFIDETCGYCLPKKTAPSEFARKVKAICSLPKKEYEKLRKSASKKVQFLDWQEIVPQTIAVYRRLAEGKTEEKQKVFLKSQSAKNFQEKMFSFFSKPRGERRAEIVAKENFYLLGIIAGSFLVNSFYFRFSKYPASGRNE